MDMRQVEEVVQIEQVVCQKNYTIGLLVTIIMIVETMTGFYIKMNCINGQ